MADDLVVLPEEPDDGFWAVTYLHDWDPDGKIYPEVHAIYRTMQEANSVIRKMGNPDKYWAVRVRWGKDVPHGR